MTVARTDFASRTYSTDYFTNSPIDLYMLDGIYTVHTIHIRGSSDVNTVHTLASCSPERQGNLLSHDRAKQPYFIQLDIVDT